LGRVILKKQNNKIDDFTCCEAENGNNPTEVRHRFFFFYYFSFLRTKTRNCGSSHWASRALVHLTDDQVTLKRTVATAKPPLSPQHQQHYTSNNIKKRKNQKKREREREK
jgi:hypothetical protein